MILASKSATAQGPQSHDYCGLLIDEMIITNGIVYSVTQQKVFGLAELQCHDIKREIYQKIDNVSEHSYFKDTDDKLSGHTATGLTQVKIIKSNQDELNGMKVNQIQIDSVKILSNQIKFTNIKLLTSMLYSTPPRPPPPPCFLLIFQRLEW